MAKAKQKLIHPNAKLPCKVKCEGGPSFGAGVKVSTLLGYLARRVEYNKEPPMSEEQKALIRDFNERTKACHTVNTCQESK